MQNNQYSTIPRDGLVLEILGDGNASDTSGNGNDGTATDITWLDASKGYVKEAILWNSSSLTWSSTAYSNSYIIINGILVKNSSEVTDTGLNGTDGNKYGLIKLYNKTLTNNEEQALKLEGQRRLGNGASYPALMDGTVAYYDFKGDANDIVGGNNGTVSGATLTTDHLGNANSAYNFDGSNDYIDTGFKFKSTELTMSCCIKTTDIPSGDTGIISNYDAGTPGEHMGMRINRDDGLLYTYADDNSNASWGVNSTTVVTDGNWHICTFTFKANDKMKVYVDGVLENDYDTSTGPVNNYRNWFIGKDGEKDEFFNGDIASPVILNRALSEDEVSALYTLTKNKYIYPFSKSSTPNLQDGLVMSLDGSNNGTTTVFDTSGNGVNGTVSSTPTYSRVNQSKIIGLSSQSIDWTSTSYATSTCLEKISGKWKLQINPSYISETGIDSGTRDVTDIRLYSRILTDTEIHQLKYLKYI